MQGCAYSSYARLVLKSGLPAQGEPKLEDESSPPIGT